MSKFTLFDKEIVFSDSQDRFITLVEMIPEIKNDARDYFRKVYEERWCDIEDVLEEYDTATTTLISHMLKDKLYRYLIDADIYDISEDSMIESCWDTSSADEAYDIIAEAYNDIIDDYEEEIEYRRSRKENRGKVIGGGFGFSGAVKGMAMAGAMNAASGLGHSIVNAFGNLKSSLNADNAKEELFESSKTYKLLENGVVSSIVATIQAFITFINNYRETEGEDVWFDGSQFDVKRAETLLVNAIRFPEKRKDLLFKAFALCPYHPDILKAIFANCESERQNVVYICNALNIDLDEIYEKVIESMYPNKDGNCDTETEDDDFDDFDDFDEDDEDDDINAINGNVEYSLDELIIIRNQIKAFMAEFEIEDSDTLDQLEEDIIYLVAEDYDDLEFDSRNEVVDKIISCEISEKIKKDYILDNKVWELFEQYDIILPEDDKLLFVFEKYEEILLIPHVSEQKIISLLDAVIRSIGFTDENGTIPFKKKEEMFECLTGILEEQLKSKLDILELKDDLSSKVAEKVGEIIRDSNIDFLTTSLKYRRPHEDLDATFLKYCEIDYEEEIPFIVYDERPIMSPGVYGFCLTDKRLVGRGECESAYSIPTDQIVLFEKKGFLSSKFIVYYKNGSREINAENLSSIGDFVDCLNKIIAVLPNNERAIKARESKLDKKMAEASLNCIDKHPWLISYFGMEEKVNNIRETVGSFSKSTAISKDEYCSTKPNIQHSTITNGVQTDTRNDASVTPYILNEEDNQLLTDVSALTVTFIKSIMNFFKPEVYIHKNNGMEEYKKNDKWARVYAREEFPVFYISQLNVGDHLPSLSITNRNMYSSMSASIIPLESILDIKANLGRKSKTLSVITTSATFEISTELPDEGKEHLASTLKAIIELVLKSKPASDKNDIVSNEVSEDHDNLNENLINVSTTENSIITKQELIDTVRRLLNQYGVGAHYYIPNTPVFDDKLAKATKHYASISAQEIPLIIEDSTMFGSAKEGFVLTNMNIYVNNMVDKKIKIPRDQLTQIGFVQSGSNTFYVGFCTLDYICKVSHSSNETTVTSKATFLNEVNKFLSTHQISSDTWLCQCGNTNSGKFCSKCGKARNQ